MQPQVTVLSGCAASVSIKVWTPCMITYFFSTANLIVLAIFSIKWLLLPFKVSRYQAPLKFQLHTSGNAANYSLISKQIEFRLNFWTPLWQKLTSCPWACCYLSDIFLFGCDVYYTLNTRDTLSVGPHISIF